MRGTMRRALISGLAVVAMAALVRAAPAPPCAAVSVDAVGIAALSASAPYRTASAFSLGASAMAEPAATAPHRTVSTLSLNLVTNGGFESNGGVGTNTFTGWTVVDQTGSSGSWCVQTGTASPINAYPVPAPPEGTFAAMTDQAAPGSHILYQDVGIPPQGATLQFDLFISNHAAAFSVPNPETLDYTVSPNQHFRVDIMDPAAAVADVGAGVIENLFITNAGYTPPAGYQTLSFKLSGAAAGRTVRVRFAEVDNQTEFNAGVDNVTLTANEAIPAVSVPGLGALILALLFVAVFVLRRLAD